MGPIPACDKCITLWHSQYEEIERPGVFLYVSIHQVAGDQSIHMLLERMNAHTGKKDVFKPLIVDSKQTEYASHVYKGFLESEDFTSAFKPVVSGIVPHKPMRPPPQLPRRVCWGPSPSVQEEEDDDDDDDDDNDVEPRQRSSKTSGLDLDTLSQYFKYTSQEASKMLNISGTTLKKLCRQHGLPRWPHRKVKSFKAKEEHQPPKNGWF